MTPTADPREAVRRSPIADRRWTVGLAARPASGNRAGRLRVPRVVGSPEDRPDTGDVVFYRRAGCPFCWMLRRKLRRSGVTLDERDIWDDPADAAFVRSVAGGNETVPTVVVGGAALVNPSAAAVVARLRDPGDAHGPEPRRPGRGPRRRRLHRP